ncbi:putative transferase CAF17 homolog, mitochondrial [Zerene cesonia]|uniref:putative transferase CAF17 homolog, mitochondrial n=1 Tax=Zerene cesonia TaxID=33412 RepID=UPI0018E5210E|nr:putative transferase CAF17 homolog, mitochondrial [Zerene cesonia]
MISLHQVNKYFHKPHYVKQYLRFVHNVKEPPKKILYPLHNRSLLKITGSEASLFLQGLITNDMRHFEESAKSVYAMFLNNKGKVLYDTLIHKWDDENSFILECDQKIAHLLEKHLKMFKLRRKVSIEDVNKQFRLWNIITPTDSMLNENVDTKSEVNIYKDPRLSDLGYRLIAAAPLSGSEIVASIGNDVAIEQSDDGYKYLRYKLGVSEGADDLPPGTSFPLEVNCDYLHGVSFHKGCYIGQEVTARVHHTGVVRKRIMPIKFTNVIEEDLEKDLKIIACENPKLSLGKLKGIVKNYGLGLLRIKEAIDYKILNVGHYSGEAVKPDWWPMEAPKEVPKTE